jgi:multidrug resistance efflux pump
MAGEVADRASRWRGPSSASVWRWIRILAGIALLAIGLWSLGPQFVFRVTREARINARVIPVHAPIEGQVVVAPPAPGTPLARGDIATVIANPALDRGRYEQLVTERAMLAARIEAADGQLAALTDLRREFDERLERFRGANLRRSALRIREAQAAFEVAASVATERHDEADRKRNLGADGVASPAAVLSARRAAEQAEVEATRLRITAERLAHEHAALEEGVLVGEERDDVPYSQQRVDEIRLRAVEIVARRREDEARLAALNRAITAESRRLDRLARAEVRAPSTGILWQSLAVQGASVGPTTELFTLIDCTELVVTAKYSERYFESILPGQRATVQLLGGGNLDAVVESVRGLDVSSAEDRLAARMMDLADGEFLVTLRLDSAELRGRKAAFCQVGRSVEVVLAADDSAFVRLTQRVVGGLEQLAQVWRQAVAHESTEVVGRDPLSGS